MEWKKFHCKSDFLSQKKKKNNLETLNHPSSNIDKLIQPGNFKVQIQAVLGFVMDCWFGKDFNN